MDRRVVFFFLYNRQTEMNRAAFALILLASQAFAHLPQGEHGSFLAGATHPLFGLDQFWRWSSLASGRG